MPTTPDDDDGSENDHDFPSATSPFYKATDENLNVDAPTSPQQAHARRDGRIYLHEMAAIVDRRPHTIRQWLSQGVLPGDLVPSREGGRETIYWVESQVDGLKKFARAREARRGWGHLHQSNQGENE